MSEGTVTVGVGFTVIVYEEVVPGQLLTTGVTTIVAIIGVFPVFVAVKEAISPVPLEASPMAVFEFVQEKEPPAGTVVKLVAGTISLLQTPISVGTVTVGVGLTVMVKEEGVPMQEFTEGETVMVAVIGEVPVLTAVKDSIFPVPPPVNPMAVLVFVHVKDPPAGTLVKVEAGILSPLQTVISEGTVTVGVGFTVIVNDDGVPGHPLTAGVTEMLAEMGAVPGLVEVKEGIFPVPLEASPMAVLSLDHVNVPPAGVDVKLVAETISLLQTDKFAGTVTVGVGLTVMVYVEGTPGHPLMVAVTEMVAMIGAFPVLVALKDGISPVPLSVSPIAVFEFIQLKVPPAGVLAKVVPVTVSPLQTEIFAGTVTVAVGITVIT